MCRTCLSRNAPVGVRRVLAQPAGARTQAGERQGAGAGREGLTSGQPAPVDQAMPRLPAKEGKAYRLLPSLRST